MAHLRQVGLTELAELSVVSSGALALPGDAGPVVVAVRDLALVVPDAALGPLPARVAAATSLLVLSTPYRDLPNLQTSDKSSDQIFILNQ